MFVSIGLIIFKNFFFCKTCVESKQQTNKFPKLGGMRATLLVGIVHLDVCGNIQIHMISGFCYFITFIDDFSWYFIVYFIKSKKKTFDKFVQCINN